MSKKVTKHTLTAKARKFATEFWTCWDELDKFVDSNTKGKDKRRKEAFRDSLCEIVDKYIDFNCKLRDWCHKNKVDLDEFICDVVNMGTTSPNGRKH